MPENTPARRLFISLFGENNASIHCWAVRQSATFRTKIRLELPQQPGGVGNMHRSRIRPRNRIRIPRLLQYMQQGFLVGCNPNLEGLIPLNGHRVSQQSRSWLQPLFN